MLPFPYSSELSPRTSIVDLCQALTETVHVYVNPNFFTFCNMESKRESAPIWNKNSSQKQVTTPFSNWPSLHDPLPQKKAETPSDFNLIPPQQKHYRKKPFNNKHKKRPNQVDVLKQWIVYQVYLTFNPVNTTFPLKTCAKIYTLES
jgi:hypothetical protein